MTRFTVRVQLHKKDGSENEIESETYQILHSKMEELGFTKTIKSVKGTIHDLPTAEYSYITTNENITKYQILESAKSAATQTKELFSILVTKSEEGRCWFNLDQSEGDED
jgi:hypothetical protein